MAEIVNLRQSRKRKKREDKERAADANRITFGRTAVEKKESALARGLGDRRLEGHRRRPPSDGDGH